MRRLHATVPGCFGDTITNGKEGADPRKDGRFGVRHLKRQAASEKEVLYPNEKADFPP